jgi:hypothetical protein
MESISLNRTDDMIASWGETAAGLLPVIILSMATTMEGTSNQTFLFPLLTSAFLFC